VIVLVLTCANKKCHKQFKRKASNQIYCSSECCKVVTSENLKRKYRLEKERKSGTTRICASCPTKLSKYNVDTECLVCVKKYTPEKRQKLKELLWS